MKPVSTALILGAASDIGLALARAFARDGYAVILAARNASRLEADAADIRLRSGVDVRLAEFDVIGAVGPAEFADSIGPLPEIVVCVVGLMGSQTVSQTDAAAADLVMRTNYNGPVLFLGEFANRMNARGSGTIIGISSVAGDRGRQSNYIYGAAKAGLTAFLSGLRNRLSASGVHVITVKPGYVRTRMTEGMQLPAILTAAPEDVGDYVVAHLNRDVIYVRPVWRLIMAIVRGLPERLFKKTKL